MSKKKSLLCANCKNPFEAQELYEYIFIDLDFPFGDQLDNFFWDKCHKYNLYCAKCRTQISKYDEFNKEDLMVLSELRRRYSTDFYLTVNIRKYYDLQYLFTVEQSFITGIAINRYFIKDIGWLFDTLKKFKQLKWLVLRETKISFLPQSLFDLEHLIYLNLSFNSIEQLPPEISRLKNLKTLKLSENELRSIPESLGELTSLEKLDLSYNPIREKIPLSIGRLPQLKQITLLPRK